MKQIWNIKGNMLLIIIAIMFLTSCIEGYTDDWTFSAGVKGVTLESPSSDKVVISKNAEGTELTIQWPVVYGAGGYQFSLYIVDDPENPVVVGEENQVIDGCSVKRPLQEDTKYKIIIKTLGNEKYDNKDAVSATEIAYSTLIPATVIPDGTDLSVYFTENAIPTSTDEIAYELVAGGHYTLSAPVDFGAHWLTLRGDKVNRPTITYAIAGRLSTTAGLTMKFINFDCKAVAADATNGALLLLSATPDPAILGTGSYYIIPKPVVLKSCNITGINKRLIYDNNQKYALSALLIKDCIIPLNTTGDGIIYMQSGFINNFTISNSTVYSLVASSGYFLRYNNSGRPDRAGFVSGSINFYNNTFYNVVNNGQMGNYSGMNSAYVKLNVSQNIFVDCGAKYVIRRLSGGGNNMVKTLKDNCYWYGGAFPQAEEIDHTNGDKSGTGYGEDPAFANATGGDFTVGTSATTIISKKGGDPRWLPTAQ